MDKITNNCRQNAGNDLFTGLIKYGDRIEVQAICGQMVAIWRGQDAIYYCLLHGGSPRCHLATAAADWIDPDLCHGPDIPTPGYIKNMAEKNI
jgi:hypothetical protein